MLSTIFVCISCFVYFTHIQKCYIKKCHLPFSSLLYPRNYKQIDSLCFIMAGIGHMTNFLQGAGAIRAEVAYFHYFNRNFGAEKFSLSTLGEGGV